MRRRVTAYFERRQDAVRAADELRPLVGAVSDVEIVDAGLADDLDTFSRIGVGVAGGGLGGAVVGVVAGLVLRIWIPAEWGPVLAMCAIAMGVFGALAGGMFASAIGGARDAEGEGVALIAYLPAERVRAGEERLARFRAARTA